MNYYYNIQYHIYLYQIIMISNVRVAMHAGEWYTNDPKKLNQQLGLYLKNANQEIKQMKKIKGVVGPHAGYYFSGPTAAWAYKYLKPSQQQLKVFLLGPSHHIYIQGCGLTTMQYWDTPFGKIQVDTQITQKLKQQGKFRYIQQDDQEEEHSLQMHLPYIRKCLGQKIKLIPIMVGATNQKMQQEYAKLLLPYFELPNSLFIISSDFCHWGQRFQYTYANKSDGLIWQSIEKLDGRALNLIQNHDPIGFNKYLSQTQNTICGRHPISIYLNILKLSKLNLKTKFVKYAQSEQVKSKQQSSVSYASGLTYQQQ